jgi:hypothetical protein
MQHGIGLPRGGASHPIKTIRQVMLDAINDHIKWLKGK